VRSSCATTKSTVPLSISISRLAVGSAQTLVHFKSVRIEFSQEGSYAESISEGVLP